MPLDFNRARSLLKSCQLTKLFVEELGWEPFREKLTLTVGNQDFELSGIAEKGHFTAWLHQSPDSHLPDHAARRKLDNALAQSYREHFVVFTTADQTRQSWMWPSRERGKPLSLRTHEYFATQQGDSLLQKLDRLYVSLEEEEKGRLSVVEVARRARAAFDVEKVTKKFYKEFDAQRKAFLKLIQGIQDLADREWYASVMLNRLMFVYFIQRKGFLDGDQHYLRNRLARVKEAHGQDQFYSFYRTFLLRLFHDGLGGKERSPELNALLGRIPYLNGGMFAVHELEQRHGKTIQIPDKAFEAIFNYFDLYQWHLDERPLRADNEINPDVLGYIFEKYINQKQMGAYYTKEDITEYIAKNTVIPFLFDAARKECKVSFDNPGGPTVWDLLRDNPDRYIYPAVRHGAEKPLPPDIAAGVNPPTLHQPVGDGPVLTLELRKGWNRPAPAEYALPTEIWREVVARRQRYEEVRGKLARGEVRDINDLITLNLDIRQFAQDVIENCEGPELLRAFWHAIERVSILDPTCGSGAFLFAALNILEPLYEACLERMEAFLADLENSEQKHSPQKFSDFRQVLGRLAAHPNQRYFIFKSIILNNLYGVDIMEEAVEICQLRLFLKLAAQVDPDPAKENLGIEPLPDIDFNIRAGNTLVGYANAEGVRRAFKESQGQQGKLMLGDMASAYQRFEEKVELADRAFRHFREMQSDQGMAAKDFVDAKKTLLERLNGLNEELNLYLAREYGVKEGDKAAYTKWISSHQPFHWLIEFYRIISDGGFDVIIGNPPYVELKALGNYELKGYKCERSGNLYALVIERCYLLGRKNAWQGYIVPVSSVSTDRYVSLQQLLVKREDYYSSFDDRPSRLFDGLEHIRLTIHILGRQTASPRLLSTRYNKWISEERASLFSTLTFTWSLPILIEGTIPKLCTILEQSIINNLGRRHQRLCSFYRQTTKNKIFYSRKVGYFLQVLDFEPRVVDGQGRRRPPSEFKDLKFGSMEYARLALCCLNSNLFYWFITVFSDCRHVNKREVDAFPVDIDSLASSRNKQRLLSLADILMKDIQNNSKDKVMSFKHDTLTVQCIYPKVSKFIIDNIDRHLAQHYGFTEEELDFIINYDIKYRMGREAEGEDD
jgi:type I restriction-modification system DNA methylase subunit